MTNQQLAGSQVLIVEDEMMIAIDLSLAVEDVGGIVIGPADTVNRALALLQLSNPDAAILDVRLGRDHVGKVAEALTARRIPFLFHTGHADEKMLAKWPSAPIVRKPIAPSEVVELLAGLLT